MQKYIPTIMHGKRVYCKHGLSRVHINATNVCSITYHKKNHDQIILTGKSYPDPVVPPSPSTFYAYMCKECITDAWIHHNYTLMGSINDIVQALGRGTMKAVSDGSCDHSSSIGTSGWCIMGCGAAIRGVNITPTGSDRMDSMRCELSGMYSIVRVIELLTTYFDVRAGGATIGCDCDTAHFKTILSTDTSPLNQIKGNHCDIINAINGYVRDSICLLYTSPSPRD